MFIQINIRHRSDIEKRLGAATNNLHSMSFYFHERKRFWTQTEQWLGGLQRDVFELPFSPNVGSITTLWIIKISHLIDPFLCSKLHECPFSQRWWPKRIAPQALRGVSLVIFVRTNTLPSDQADITRTKKSWLFARTNIVVIREWIIVISHRGVVLMSAT